MRTKFFTGKGDGGASDINGRMVSKTNPAVRFLGALDELNSLVGFAKANGKIFVSTGKVAIASELHQIQEDLFIIQAETAKIAFGYEKGPALGEEKVKKLEALIAVIDAELPPLKNFVISGGSELSARLDLARALAGRVERMAKEYAETETANLSPIILRYLNRLSSVLFALARYANHVLSEKEDHPSY